MFVGVNFVFDSVGMDTINNSLDSLSFCGHLVNFGQSSGPINPIEMSSLAKKSLTVTRPILFHYLTNIEIYKDIPKDKIPDTESLKDTYDRVIPYFKKNIEKK